MIGPNRTTTTFGSIYQNKVDGEPGADVLHVDNIACTDITDGRWHLLLTTPYVLQDYGQSYE